MTKKFQLVSEFAPTGDQPVAINTLVDGLSNGEMWQTLLGVTGSGKTFTIANVIQKIQRPTMIMAPNKTLAAQLYSEMKEFFPHNAVEYFVSYYDYYQPEAYVPSSDTFIDKDASINDHIEQMRLSATKAMLERRDAIIVSSVSCIYGLGEKKAYTEMILHLVQGEHIHQRAILRRLAELQYKRNDIELHRATYRVRGDVIDVFPAESARDAVRIELFDDEIEQISYFDPLTGEVQQYVSRITIYPKTHYVTPRAQLLAAVADIKTEMQHRLAILTSSNKLIEAQRLQERVQFDIEMILELGYCNGIENYSRHLAGRQAGKPPPTLFDYLPDDSLLVLDESHVMVPQIGAMYRGDKSRKTTLVEYGFRLPSALDNRPLMFAEWEELAPQTIFVSATPADYERARSSAVVEQVVRPTGLIDPDVEVRPVATQVDDLLSEINKRVSIDERVLVTTLTKKMAEDLTDYLREHDIKVRYLHSDIDTVERMDILRDLRLGVFDTLIGINLLREGLDIPEVSLVAILDADKEGFLRSERSLIQTIGRAARNINGKAILYADELTGSMQRAIDETNRRREKQVDYNAMHGITPQGVKKSIRDGLDDSQQPNVKVHAAGKKMQQHYAMTPEQLAERLQQMEQVMYRHAQNLEFEQAAAMRDKIEHMRTISLGLAT